MKKSNRISTSDAVQLLRVVAEAYESGQTTEARLTHLVTEGCRVIGARMGSACRVAMPSGDTEFELFKYLEGGDWTDHDRAMLREYYSRGDHEQDIMAARIGSDWHQLRSRSAVLRQELISTEEWYGSDHVNEFRRTTDIDSCIYSGMSGTEDVEFVGMTFHRCWGEKAFGERERVLIEVLQQGAVQLFQSFAADGSSPRNKVDLLPPRPKQVLGALFKGDSEKQVARRLGITKATVHTHVKFLYKAFGVSSRGELFALIVAERLMESVVRIELDVERS